MFCHYNCIFNIALLSSKNLIVRIVWKKLRKALLINSKRKLAKVKLSYYIDITMYLNIKKYLNITKHIFKSIKLSKRDKV